jgi:predicted MFS family arabinose efflux permease
MARLLPSQAVWRRPSVLLYVLSVAMAVSLATSQALINNFAVERIGFNGVDIGFLQTVREIPGLLAFTVLFVLLIVREQALAYLTLILLGIGTAVTGLFPSHAGLYTVALVASVGFHYLEAIRQSLVFQWVDKTRAPETMGRIIAFNSFASLASFGAIWLLLRAVGLDMKFVYMAGGAIAIAIAICAWTLYPRYEAEVRQSRKIVLRARYRLFYALIFLSGGRRQIISVFAPFLMVQRFGFDAATMTLMLLVNYGINVFLGANVGRLIIRWGERRALLLEYTALIGLFVAYAFVTTAWIAVGLYVLDNVLFAMAIAIRTYYQKIADPADMSNSSGVSSTINHIAAVFLPAGLGFIWLTSPSAVFLIGAGFACCSLACAVLVPRDPAPGNEVAWLGRRRVQATPAE